MSISFKNTKYHTFSPSGTTTKIAKQLKIQHLAIFILQIARIFPDLFRDSGYFRLAGACHEYSVASLNMKNFTSPTPRNCVRKALIFALNDSAEALVSLSSK